MRAGLTNTSEMASWAKVACVTVWQQADREATVSCMVAVTVVEFIPL